MGRHNFVLQWIQWSHTQGCTAQPLPALSKSCCDGKSQAGGGSNTIFASKANVFGSQLFSPGISSHPCHAACVLSFASFRLLYCCAELQNIPACQAGGEALLGPGLGLQSGGIWVPCQRAVPAACLLIIHHLSSMFLCKRFVSLAQNAPIYIFLKKIIYCLYSCRVKYSDSHDFFSFLVSHPQRLVETLSLSFILICFIIPLFPPSCPRALCADPKGWVAMTEAGVTDQGVSWIVSHFLQWDLLHFSKALGNELEL